MGTGIREIPSDYPNGKERKGEMEEEAREFTPDRHPLVYVLAQAEALLFKQETSCKPNFYTHFFPVFLL